MADAHRGQLARPSTWADQAPKISFGNAEAVDFLFKRVHSVWNNRNSHSLMIGRESAHSERSPPLRETSEPTPPPAFSGGRSYGPEGRLDMPTASECRQHAKECLQLASTAVDFYVQAALTELAGDFQEMAAIRERTKPTDPR